MITNTGLLLGIIQIFLKLDNSKKKKRKKSCFTKNKNKENIENY